MYENMIIHPLAKIFPVMNEATFESLKNDIGQNGQREPVVFWRGYLIDGRNRWKACDELGIDVNFREASPNENPLSLVISLNINRRHMTNAQRAMAAAKLANLAIGRRSAKWQQGVSVEDAARLMSCSPRMVSRAKFILENGVPLLSQQVDEGKMSLSRAERIARQYHMNMQVGIITGEANASFKDVKRRYAAAVTDHDWIEVFLHSPCREDLLFELLASLSKTERMQASNWLWIQEERARNED